MFLCVQIWMRDCVFTFSSACIYYCMSPILFHISCLRIKQEQLAWRKPWPPLCTPSTESCLLCIKPEVVRRRCADYSGIAHSDPTPLPLQATTYPPPRTTFRMCSVLWPAHCHLDTSLTYEQLLGAHRSGSQQERVRASEGVSKWSGKKDNTKEEEKEFLLEIVTSWRVSCENKAKWSDEKLAIAAQKVLLWDFELCWGYPLYFTPYSHLCVWVVVYFSFHDLHLYRYSLPDSCQSQCGIMTVLTFTSRTEDF